MLEDRESENYNIARAVVIIGLTFFMVGALAELLIVIIGYTISFHKNNVLILSLNIFAVYLLGYFIFDGWHYVTIWYIFIVAQVPQSTMEMYGFIYSIVYQFAKYNRIKNNRVQPLSMSKKVN